MEGWETWTPSEIADYLNRLPFVKWDRMTHSSLEGTEMLFITVYGWIERKDGRADFVQIEFGPWEHETVGWSTSSAIYSPLITTIVHGPDAVHNACETVDSVLGDLVPNRVGRKLILPR